VGQYKLIINSPILTETFRWNWEFLRIILGRDLSSAHSKSSGQQWAPSATMPEPRVSECVLDSEFVYRRRRRLERGGRESAAPPTPKWHAAKTRPTNSSIDFIRGDAPFLHSSCWYKCALKWSSKIHLIFWLFLWPCFWWEKISRGLY